MIVWLNGAFGAGKTTLADRLRLRRPDLLLFVSQRAHPAVLEAAGFTFRHPDVDAALTAAFGGDR